MMKGGPGSRNNINEAPQIRVISYDAPPETFDRVFESNNLPVI